MNRRASRRNRAIVRKPVLIGSELHRKLKLIAFNCDVRLQDLMDAIVGTTLNHEARIKEILKELNVRNSS